MFYSLTGTVVHIDENTAALSCGGVAFLCQCSAWTLRSINSGEDVTLYTHLSVREDALELFGFIDKAERECFRLLIGVTGVGPKAALSILSAMTPQSLAVSIASGDVKSITRAQGVGPKIAQRIVLELKDKLSAELPGSKADDGSALVAAMSVSGENEAVEALVMLGYSRSEASVAVGRLDDGLSTEELIKQALRSLAR